MRAGELSAVDGTARILDLYVADLRGPVPPADPRGRLTHTVRRTDRLARRSAHTVRRTDP